MALKTCPDCGHQVSKKANACPSCGRPLQQQGLTGCSGCLVLALVIFVGVIVLAYAVGDSVSTGTSSGGSSSGSTPRHEPWHAERNINVRQGPGTDYPIAYTLSAGDITYPAMTNADGWAPVRSGPAALDTIGWVLRELLVPGNPPRLLLSNLAWDPGGLYESAAIVGDVRNLTGSTLGYAQITCTLFDAQDRQIGTAFTNTNDLAGGAVWHFRALVLEDEALRYRCSAPEGF